jgi:hypothetical protein
MKTTRQSQTKRIADYLLQGNSITPLEALDKFDCFRLGARVKDLREQGFDIETETARRGSKRFANYRLRITENN